MNKKSTSVALTGGAGFEFEDYIAAYFMIHLLSNVPPIDTGFGVVVSVDFQVSESGWLLDDLLITGKGNEELLRRLSISVKRDKQVTRNGFPPHFVEAIWKQWLETQSNPFVKDQDLLCLAVGKISDTVKEAWDEMLKQALRTCPERMVKRLSPQSKSNSKIQKNIFNSLHCPKNFKQMHNIEDVDTARLLKHVRLLHFDFHSPQSNDEKKVIQLCRDCISSGSIDEAKELWDKLVAIAADLRSKGGTIDRTQLIRKLHKFKLIEFPDLRSDWTILQKVSEDGMSAVRTEIGHGVVISREAIINQINHKLNNLRIQVMLGESGSGKSALAKTIAGSRKYDKVVWFNTENLNGQGLHQVSRKLGLQHDLTKLLPAAGNLKALLVLDAVEKFSKDCLRNTAKLIDSLNLDEEGARWFVLLTVQPLNWMNIQQELHLNGLKLSKEIVTMVELPDQQELTPVFHKLPTIEPLMLRPGLQRLLRNFKILDWIARALDNQQPALSYWVSESDLINWLWNSWVKTGKEKYNRAGLLKKIGEKEAQSFAGGVPLHDLTSDENRVLEELEGSQLLRVKEERVYFTHDLLGDWSRLHKLIGLNELERAETLKILAEIPRWHHAVRLYGLRILEQELDSTRWFKLYQQLSGASTHGSVAADIILEAVALSTNASILLECVWPHLSTENGVLLNKLIKRFRHVASFPDHIVQSSTNDDDLKIWFAASFRIPYWPYWGPMLTFLHAHAEEVKKIAFHSISELCLLWLSQIPVEISHGTAFPWRREAAELALLAAREVQGLKAEDVSFHDGHDDAPYEAFLYAAPEFPEKVSALALELAQRRPPAPEIQQRFEESDRRRSEKHKKRLKEDSEYRERFECRSQVPPNLSRGPRLDPWPDGPSDRIDEAFRKACMKTKALYFLMKYRPEVVQEVFLALSIEPPRDQYEQMAPFELLEFGTSDDNGEIIFLHRPFLLFLQTSPTEAIELIVKLVNFATERWLDLYRAHPGSGVDNDINEEKTIDLWIGDNKYKWTGNYRVFGWYRSHRIDAKYVISVLMALETWFYDEVDAGRDITKWVKKIFKDSRSTAFVGVFVALAKKQPELLLNCLMPILSIWQIFSWDIQLIQSDIPLYVYGLSIGEKAFNMVRDWNQLPHRKIKILDQVIKLMLSNKDFRTDLKKIIKKWRKALKHTKDRKNLELTIERLNPANYKSSNNKANNMFLFEWPEYLRDSIKIHTERSSHTMNIINFSIHCQQILEDNQPLDSDSLERHWEMLKYIADSLETQDQEVELHQNAVMGGIAVLISLHSNWLRMGPEKEQWCKHQIQQIITKKHSIKQFNTTYSNLELNWLNFFG
jgi:energy-coupling factor transporter ATP-binding protein EcfA2